VYTHKKKYFFSKGEGGGSGKLKDDVKRAERKVRDVGWWDREAYRGGVNPQKLAHRKQRVVLTEHTEFFKKKHSKTSVVKRGGKQGGEVKGGKIK
jgi:hypothetical protein